MMSLIEERVEIPMTYNDLSVHSRRILATVYINGKYSIKRRRVVEWRTGRKEHKVDYFYSLQQINYLFAENLWFARELAAMMVHGEGCEIRARVEISSYLRWLFGRILNPTEWRWARGLKEIKQDRFNMHSVASMFKWFWRRIFDTKTERNYKEKKKTETMGGSSENSLWNSDKDSWYSERYEK